MADDAVARLFAEGERLFRRLLQSQCGTGAVVFHAHNHKPAHRVEYREQRTFYDEKAADALVASR